MLRISISKLFTGGVFVAALVLLLLLGSFSDGGSPAAADNDIIPGQYVVVLRDGADADALADTLGRRHGFMASVVYRHALKGFAAAGLSERSALALQADPNVLFVEPARIFRTADQQIPTGVRRIATHFNSTANIDGQDDEPDIDIAIIDTGVDVDHPDLRVVGGVRYLGFLGCGDGSGSFDDDNGHGSHVAGTAAAIDDDMGVVGVAPGARIWAVKVLSGLGFGSTICIIAGVDWVTANASTIDVANMSLGGFNSNALCNAIGTSVAAGVTYVVAAGNENQNASNRSPANCPDVITVSAVSDYDGRPRGLSGPTCANFGADDTLASFSNFGPVVDIAAPGVCILSTWKNGGYNTISGTSMATPHVAGAAALHLINNPGASPTDVKAALLARAVPQGNRCSFTGDKDIFPEPMVWLGPLWPCYISFVP